MNTLYLIPYIILVILYLIFLISSIRLIIYSYKSKSKIIKKINEVSSLNCIFFSIELNLFFLLYCYLAYVITIEGIILYYVLFIIVVDSFNRNIMIVSNEKICTVLFTFKKQDIKNIIIKDNPNWWNKVLEITTNDNKNNCIPLSINDVDSIKNILESFEYTVDIKEEAK